MLAAQGAGAHGVLHETTTTAAVVVTFLYGDGTPLMFGAFEVRGPGDQRPALVGMTDRAGRVLFAPDRPGRWEVRVRTDDGHGDVAVVDVGPDLLADGRPVGLGRWPRALIGVVLILALATVLSRVLGGRRPTSLPPG